jgi:hypothetical protein
MKESFSVVAYLPKGHNYQDYEMYKMEINDGGLYLAPFDSSWRWTRV